MLGLLFLIQFVDFVCSVLLMEVYVVCFFQLPQNFPILYISEKVLLALAVAGCDCKFIFILEFFALLLPVSHPKPHHFPRKRHAVMKFEIFHELVKFLKFCSFLFFAIFFPIAINLWNFFQCFFKLQLVEMLVKGGIFFKYINQSIALDKLPDDEIFAEEHKFIDGHDVGLLHYFVESWGLA